MEVKVFGMTNCAGCDTVKSVLVSKGVEFEYLDVMNVMCMEEASKYGVRGVPTTIVTHDDHSYETIVGSTPTQIKIILESVGQ